MVGIHLSGVDLSAARKAAKAAYQTESGAK